MAEVTSGISPVVTGSGKSKTTTYMATKVTGPTKNNAGDIEYNPELVQYDSATGTGGKTIAIRDAFNGSIDWNAAAPSYVKKYENIFKKASNNQIDSISTKLAFTAAERIGLNKSSGKGSEDLYSRFNNSGLGNNLNVDFGTGIKLSEAMGGVLSNKSAQGGGGNSDCSRGSYPTLVYPTTLRTTQQDCLRIDILKYQPKKLGGGFKFKPRRAMSSRAIGGVTLPAPGGINDGNSTAWGQRTMTPVQMAASDAVKKLMTDGGEAAGKSLQDTLNDVMGEKENIKTALANAITENITGATDLLSRTEGMVMNPNMELLFQGPSLRPFTFTYKLSPRDERESMNILRIIRMFKQSMASQTTQASLFLKAPNTYKLEFLSSQSNKAHRFLPKIKECALQNFTVNYTPDGSYMSYENSSMVAYELSFSFQEIEPIYNSDYSDLDGDNDFSIGY